MKNVKKVIRNIFGIISLLIGIAGGFIPVLQGWIFVLLGFILIDFKKKEEWEHNIINFISKTKIGKKLADFWKHIKKSNKDIIEGDKDKISSIYKKINKADKINDMDKTNALPDKKIEENDNP